MLLSAALTLPLVASVLGQAASYAPRLVDCPTESLIERTGSPLDGSQSLQADEAAYITTRRSQVLPPLWTTYLANDTGYNVSQLMIEEPKLGIATSGGGLRASLYGAGTIAALDSRNETNLGGLLQLAEYTAGLSGGSWAVSSFAMNDLPTTYDLVLGQNGQTGWLLDMDILAPGGILGFGDNDDYYDILTEDVRAKAQAGFPVSLVDIWGRGLSMHFFNGTTESDFFDTNSLHDQGLLWSSIRYTQNFQSHAQPFPIVVSTSRVSMEEQITGNSSTVIPLRNTVFEFTPYTFGSFDHTLSARIPLTFLGTYLNNGTAVNSSACVNDFDNAGFVIGTSAALFNAVQNEFSSDTFTNLISTLLSDITDIQTVDYAVPLVSNILNSFFGFVPEGQGSAPFESNNNTVLEVTDGGENGENVPLGPLLVKARELDIILAIDASADTDFFWPNGTSLLATAERTRDYSANYTSFPRIPESPDEFVAQGLTTRPTFFGCNITTNGNVSAPGAYPIIVYMPNAPPPSGSGYLTNTSTFKLNYDPEDVVSFLDAAHVNGMKGFETGDETSDPQWPLALKCATVDRARTRAGVARSEVCDSLMNKYCWSDGVAEILTNYTASTGGNLGDNSNGGGTSGASSLSALSLSAVAGLVVATGMMLMA
ncbi:AMP-binding domain-containing protein [Leucosporidium creatinivorum]|uniref:Lysophospholipase n=1 Tax=Leucosporidium creatinivorum TaxID=106004 RepID=A0A1Y2F8G9_9BASI|nr:AMP-binding domain-containing protein [Leucosporidium creatinivorum]